MIRLSMVMKIVRKDWQDVRSNKQILVPMILIPVIFSLFLPLLSVVLPLLTAPLEELGEIAPLVPPYLWSDPVRAYLYYNMNIMIKPFFVMIPLMITVATASDSWAGEKERKTAESLLLLPLTDSELLVAKVLASFIPGMMITWICGAAVTVMIDIAVYPLINTFYLPEFSWMYLLFILGPILAFFSIFLNVWISYRSRDMKSASQIGGSVMFLFIGFLVGGIFGIIETISYMITAILGVVDILMIYFSPRIFSRENIIARI